ncbi:hypothetical protein [Candidatus Nitrosocosmicus sp. T]
MIRDYKSRAPRMNTSITIMFVTIMSLSALKTSSISSTKYSFSRREGKPFTDKEGLYFLQIPSNWSVYMASKKCRIFLIDYMSINYPENLYSFVILEIHAIKFPFCSLKNSLQFIITTYSDQSKYNLIQTNEYNACKINKHVCLFIKTHRCENVIQKDQIPVPLIDGSILEYGISVLLQMFLMREILLTTYKIVTTDFNRGKVTSTSELGYLSIYNILINTFSQTDIDNNITESIDTSKVPTLYQTAAYHLQRQSQLNNHSYKYHSG